MAYYSSPKQYENRTGKKIYNELFMYSCNWEY